MDDRFREECFWGKTVGLTAPQRRWHEHQKFAAELRQIKKPILPVGFAVTGLAVEPADMAESVKFAPLSGKSFVAWDELRFHLLFEITRSILVEQSHGVKARNRLNFATTEARQDSTGLTTISASWARRSTDAYKAPIRPHQEYERIVIDGDFVSPLAGKVLVVVNDLWVDVCVGQMVCRGDRPIVAYRFAKDCLDRLAMYVADGEEINKGELLGRTSGPTACGRVVPTGAVRSGYPVRMDFGPCDAVGAWEDQVLDLQLQLQEMQLQAVDDGESFSSFAALPRQMHIVPEGTQVQLARDGELEQRYLESVAAGLAPSAIMDSYAEQYSIPSGKDGWYGSGTLWPSHLLNQTTRAKSRPIADVRGCLPTLDGNGHCLAVFDRPALDVVSFGGGGAVTIDLTPDPWFTDRNIKRRGSAALRQS